jgi:hypothetical protein
MGISTTGLRGIVSLAHIPPKLTKSRLPPPDITKYSTMSTSTPISTSTFRNLPTELILTICSHLPTYDLFFHVSPTSRLLRTCAQEILRKRIFHEAHVSFSWCCFWCSLGDLSLNAVTRDVTRLFSIRANVHIDGVSEKATVAKLALGAMLNTFSGQQGVRVAVGDGDPVTVKVGKLPDCRCSTLLEREERRWAFLVFYFARLGKEKKRWRAITGFVSAAHILGLVIVEVWLLVVASGCCIIFFIGLDLYRLATALYGFCFRGLEVFTGYVDAWWKAWSDQSRTRELADMDYQVETGGALDGENYGALAELWSD